MRAELTLCTRDNDTPNFILATNNLSYLDFFAVTLSERIPKR